jgi:hypothetical protein
MNTAISKTKLAIIIGVTLVLMASVTVVQAQSSSPVQLYSIDSKPYGISFAEWTAKWWRWALETPKPINAVSDTTGVNCAQGQSGPVWFLAGTFGGGGVVRTCTVPAGKALLQPPINQECSYAEFPNLKTESGLRACAKNFQDKVTQVEVTIDGVKLQGLDYWNKYRIQSPLFNETFPPNNVLGIHPQPTTGVSDGVWVFLPPLPPGLHELHFKGVSVDYTTTGVTNFVADATYHLTVKP